MKAIIALVVLMGSTSAFANLSNIKHAEDVICKDAQTSLKKNSVLNLYVGAATKYHYTTFTTDEDYCWKDSDLKDVFVQTADKANCRLSKCVSN